MARQRTVVEISPGLLRRARAQAGREGRSVDALATDAVRRRVGRTPRTVEEIRDAVRAELPTVRTLNRRLRALYRELTRTAEYRRRAALIKYDDAEDPPSDYFDLEHVWMLDRPLATEDEGGCNALAELAREVDVRTDPTRWATAPAQARARRQELAERQRAAAAKDSPVGPSYEPHLRVPLSVLRGVVQALTVTANAIKSPSGLTDPARRKSLEDALREIGAMLTAELDAA